MKTPIVGLHHVTAIASDPQRNLDFYTQVLGLRFVKRTINFDDPGTYHFYFGDDIGTPGTILTFFPWAGVGPGRRGAGETIATAFSIPVGSLGYWRERMKSKGIATAENEYFGATHLSFGDPDGMVLELVEHAEANPTSAPRFSDVPAEHAVQGFFGTTLLEASLVRTEALLDVMGYRKLGDQASRSRYAPEGNARGRFLDVVIDKEARPGRMGAGTVHHIAFRTSDDAAQLDWQNELSRYVQVTPVIDRTYFHSIYFREPGGVLFEIATDSPGFLIDEPVESLGEELRIPAWFEPQRAAIEARVLPIILQKVTEPVSVPGGAMAV
jgi:glyoxalase family protein